MNDNLKARIDELTASCETANIEKTRSDKKYKDIVSEMIAACPGGQVLHPDDLTDERVRETWDYIKSEVEVSKQLQARLKDLEAQTEAQGKELMDSRSECQSLRKQRYGQDARVQNPFQDLESCQDETRRLRTQVQALQKEMLAQISNKEVITDEVFSRDFHSLVSLVKSFSRSVQPAKGINILDVLKPGVLLHDVSHHHWDTRACKKAYVEAWIWSALIDTVFKYFLGHCEDFIKLHEDWGFIFGNDWFNRWPKPTSESETWRFTTVDKFIEDVGRETLIAGQNYENLPGPNARARYLQERVLKRQTFIAQTIKSQLAAVAQTSEFSYISEIVNKAFALALNMSMQRFRVQVTWPNIGENFDANRTVPVPNRNGEDIREGVVAFIVNPGLTRWGTVHGQNFNLCHEIVPSLVQLEPVQTSQKVSYFPFNTNRKLEEVQ